MQSKAPESASPRRELPAGHENRTSVSRALPAVDVKDFAGHEAGPFEVEDRVDDVGDLADTADRVQGGELCIRLDGIHWRLDGARRDRVHSDAALGILDGERFGHGIQATLRQHRQHGGYAGDGVVDEARCDLYDMAAALLLHLGDGELRHVKEARDIDALLTSVSMRPNRAMPSEIARSAVLRSAMSPE